MRILAVENLPIADVKVIRYARFIDERGYFAEHFRKSDFESGSEMGFMKGIEFLQCNESRSKYGTIRGLHFQWDPCMGKLVRTLAGRMVDLALDIRKGSPSFGKIIAYEMPASPGADFGEWIWVPPGFAHGNYFTAESHIEYFCSGEYNPACEAGISPIAADIDWSLCNPELKKEFEALAAAGSLMSEKDRRGHSVSSWSDNSNSDRFVWENRSPGTF